MGAILGGLTREAVRLIEVKALTKLYGTRLGGEQAAQRDSRWWLRVPDDPKAVATTPWFEQRILPRRPFIRRRWCA